MQRCGTDRVGPGNGFPGEQTVQVQGDMGVGVWRGTGATGEEKRVEAWLVLLLTFYCLCDLTSGDFKVAVMSTWWEMQTNACFGLGEI